MPRIDRVRAILLIFVVCTIFLSANIFLKSHLTPNVFGMAADKWARLRGIPSAESASVIKKEYQTGDNIDTRPSTTRLDINVINLEQSNKLSDIIDTKTTTTVEVTDFLRVGQPSFDTTTTVEVTDSLRVGQASSDTNTNNTTGPAFPDGQKGGAGVEADGVRWCPDTPPFLEGSHAAIKQENTPDELIALYGDLEEGGRLRPKNCVPRQRLAIIFPYRKRYSHLHIMLHNLLPFLQRQQADVTFFVIEQAPPETFNRGALLNVGYLEANKFGDFDCFIFHDVDMIPLNDHNLYRCGDNPRHFAVAMDKYGYAIPYGDYFGGVVGFSKKQYQAVNGCSNIYFGWGGEDDDLLVRLRNKKYTMVRYDVMTARYDMIKHHRDKGNEDNPRRMTLLAQANKRQDVEGLNTSRYKVNSIHTEHLYTWINVSLNTTEVYQTAPDFTLNMMKAEKDKMRIALTKQIKLRRKLKLRSQFHRRDYT